MDRYEEAMARFKERERKHPNGYVIREMSEYVFPELAESEDEKIRKALIRKFDDISMETWAGVPKTDIIAWLDKQNPVKTKDEDEYVRTLKALISDFLYGKQEVDEAYYQRIWDWLEKRHVEQRPEEWSEEEKKMLEAIVGDIHCGADFNAEVIHEANKREKWLRALRPQPHWKPSEGQMDALRMQCDALDKAWKDPDRRVSLKIDVLKTLLNDLKKLV